MMLPSNLNIRMLQKIALVLISSEKLELWSIILRAHGNKTLVSWNDPTTRCPYLSLFVFHQKINLWADIYTFV